MTRVTADCLPRVDYSPRVNSGVTTSLVFVIYAPAPAAAAAADDDDAARRCLVQDYSRFLHTLRWLIKLN